MYEVEHIIFMWFQTKSLHLKSFVCEKTWGGFEGDGVILFDMI